MMSDLHVPQQAVYTLWRSTVVYVHKDRVQSGNNSDSSRAAE